MYLRKSLYVLKRKSSENVYTIKRTFFPKKKPPPGLSQEYILKEECNLANTYTPLPVVLHKGAGCTVWDVDGKKYLDFLAGYAALNFGHCHPRIIKTLTEQVNCLHHTSRAFYNSVLPKFGEYITKMFNYNRVIPMNTGVEGGETAIKVARRWGYIRKNIPENDAIVIMAENNFWGRTLTAVSSSTTPSTYENFGPYMPGFGIIPFNNVKALESALCNPNVCAFMIEPIQGEGGINVPCDNYLREVRRICTENNVLWICDEIQTGLGRTGELLACDYDCVRPDLLILGKALGGGVIPISAVLGNEEVMHVMTPGSHGSTFGGNPLACSIAMTALDILIEDKLIENSRNLGQRFRCEMQCRLPKEIVTSIRGKGLFNALQINPKYGKAWDICIKLKEKGLLAKNCNDYTIRFTPPLTLNECELLEAVEIITDVIHSLTPVCQ